MNAIKIEQLREKSANEIQTKGYTIHVVGDPDGQYKDWPGGFCDAHTHGLQRFCGYEISMVRYFPERGETENTCYDILDGIAKIIIAGYDAVCNYNQDFFQLFNMVTHSVWMPTLMNDMPISWEHIGNWIPDPENPAQLRIIRLTHGGEYMQCCPVSAMTLFGLAFKRGC